MNTQSLNQPKPMNLTHSNFYIRAGELTHHLIESHGEFPRTTFIARFFYENGESSFDGREWKFKLTQKMKENHANTTN